MTYEEWWATCDAGDYVLVAGLPQGRVCAMTGPVVIVGYDVRTTADQHMHRKMYWRTMNLQRDKVQGHRVWRVRSSA